MQRTQTIADVQNLVALLNIESEVMQAWPITLRKRDIVHGRLAIHPGRKRRSQLIPDFLGDLEVETKKELPRGWNIRRQDIEVVEPQESRCTERIVTLRVPLNVFRLAEKLQREAQRILDMNQFAEAASRTLGAPLHTHA